MEKPIIIANWKMNPNSLKKAKSLVSSVCKKIKKEKAEVVICPPFVYYHLLKGVKKGAQNCYFKEEGAFTGEISPTMLKDLNCDYVLVGHSERRTYFGETDEAVREKLKAVLSAGLAPVLCIGETNVQRDAGEVQQILKRELESALTGVSSASALEQRLCIAYEPIWAIGTGRPCDAEEGQKMKLLIQKILVEIL